MLSGSGRSIGSAALLFFALLLGGARLPFNDMLIELAGIVLLGVVLASRPLRSAPPGLAAAALLLLLVALVPALQLVPLPPHGWQILPGRALATDVAAASGVGDGWHAFSLDPDATLASGLAIIPAIAIFLATALAQADERRALAGVVIAGALLSALLGVAQVVGGGHRFYLYPTNHYGNPIGLFANRNAEADLLLVAIALSADFARREWSNTTMRFGALALMALFAIAVVTTHSRTGTALLLPAFMLIVPLLLGRRSPLRLLAVIAAILLAAAAVLTLSGVAQSTIARFDLLGDEFRFGFWRDTWQAVGQYWPIGSGLGTFVPVYATVESLDAISFEYVNHAHSDYLELLLETGLAGVVLLLGYIALFSRQLLRATDGAAGVATGFAAVGIAMLLLHSLVDYPLRNQSLMILFGFLNGCLFAPRQVAQRQRYGKRRRKTSLRTVPE